MRKSLIKEMKDRILEQLPSETKVTSVDIEGPEVAIYTKNPKSFFENEDYVKRVAFELKKRVNIRSDKTLLMEADKAEKLIKEIVPAEAEIKDIYFNAPFSEVEIESLKPGLVIGKGGETSKEITLKTGWVAVPVRAPTSPSMILKGLRYHLHQHAAERKKFLQETAEKIYQEPNQNQWVRLTCLGSFREVGRSCMLLETQDTRVLVDCGLNPGAKNSEEEFPFIAALRYPVQEIDAIVISHAHFDHTAFLPYLFKLGYRGPVYCTQPTRDLMALLQFDYLDITAKENKEAPYTERDVKEMLAHCITRDYREVTDIAPDIRITFHDAAHILGSSSVHFHIGEGSHNLVYSADIKYGFSRLFNNLDQQYPRLETLILESTYGSREVLPTREDAEENLIRVIKETVHKGGNVLIPVFAVGRAQEMMLVIEEYYRRGALEAKVYVDGMTKEANAIHTAYPEYLRKNVQRRILQNDSPFTSELFKTIASGKERQGILDEGGCVIIASSGMLNGGASLDYLHKMAEDEKNTLIFVGYQSEGTLGRKIQGGIKTIPIMQNGKTRDLHINMRVENIEGFSGHSDRSELINYVRMLKPMPKRIIVNHGSDTVDFAKYLSQRFKVSTNAPRNLDALRLR